MCIAAMLGLYFPATAAETKNLPPIKQEIRVVKKSDLAKADEATTTPHEVASVNTEADGNESTTSDSAHSGYIVISGAGLLLLIILLIILL